MKLQIVEYKLNCTEKNRKQEITTSRIMNQLSSKPSYRVCIHHEVPQRTISSVFIFNKSLCISLVQLVDGVKEVQPALYRSSTFCRLGVSSLHKSAMDKKTAKTNLGYGTGRVAMLGSNKCSDQEEGLGQYKSFQSKHEDKKTYQTTPGCGGKAKANDSDTKHQSVSFGFLSFRRLTSSNTKTEKQKENADEEDFFPWSNFRNRPPSFCVGRDSGTWSKAAGRQKIVRDQKDGKATEPQTVSTCHNYCGLKNDSVGGTPETLSLKEALELFRPDFISRSQVRVRRLEQRAKRRKTMQDTSPDLVEGLKEDRGRQKRNCTTPDPLSNNFFQPRGRSISGREMQLRSRRIYNKLPEVTKKKEEEKKRAVSQNNRLRAEAFKKKLLDQILQR